MTGELIFSIVLMVTPLENLGKETRATPTVSHVIQPEFKDSITCQRMALTFNKARGATFDGKRGTHYENVHGVINGAWCTVNASRVKK